MPTQSNIPSSLSDYASTYHSNPRQAALQWFQDSQYGLLFIHYGLYSLLGRHEWAQLNEKMPVNYGKTAMRTR